MSPRGLGSLQSVRYLGVMMLSVRATYGLLLLSAVSLLKHKEFPLIGRFLRNTAHMSELRLLHIVQYSMIWVIYPRKNIWRG